MHYIIKHSCIAHVTANTWIASKVLESNPKYFNIILHGRKQGKEIINSGIPSLASVFERLAAQYVAIVEVACRCLSLVSKWQRMDKVAFETTQNRQSCLWNEWESTKLPLKRLGIDKTTDNLSVPTDLCSWKLLLRKKLKYISMMWKFLVHRTETVGRLMRLEKYWVHVSIILEKFTLWRERCWICQFILIRFTLFLPN